MSNLERWHDRGADSEGEYEETPDFLRPTAQSARRTEAARKEMMMTEEHESRQRDLKLEKTSVVDQSQFRNTQIGIGYQHGCVIRQPVVFLRFRFSKVLILQ